VNIGKATDRWIPVQSSAVNRGRYKSRQRRLDLLFAEGALYEYQNVPRSKFQALLEAKSKGKFINKEIKPHHPFERKVRGEK
jgi:hypothetical protein